MPYVGTENLHYADAAISSNNFECDMLWNTIGSTSSTPCVNCDFIFDIDATYDSSSIASSNCSSLSTDLSYTYGFIENYDGAGNSVITIYDAVNGWTPWILNGTSAPGGTDVVSLSGTTFTYSTGYQDYQYQGVYYTNYWFGSAVVQ
jgi:hypothetical protein